MLLLLVISAAVGASTALSPCALPVLPALLSAGAAGGRRRPLGGVAGLSVTFLLTIIAGGELLGHLGLGGTALRRLGIAVLLVAGVAALAPEVGRRLERPLAGLSRRAPRRLGDGFGSGLAVGAALGFVYAPCAGPVLAAVIAASAATGRTVAIALAYVLGTAVVLLAVAVGGRRVLEPLRRAGGAVQVQRVLGAVMVLTAWLFAAGLDTRFETAIARHTSALELTGGLERSHALQDRLARVHGPARFATAGAPTRLKDYGPAPEFTGTQRWFNTPDGRPLSLRALRGRVVLVDFWTYTCINCLRTLPYLEAWDRRYRAAGLTIVGVHSPEFGCEHDVGNVGRAIGRLGIRYPVVQDNQNGTWDAYANMYWPADSLVDAAGEIRYVGIGEGDYDKTENAIRLLLAEAGHPRLGGDARPQDVVVPSQRTSPETYLGTQRAEGWIAGEPQAGENEYPSVAGD